MRDGLHSSAGEFARRVAHRWYFLLPGALGGIVWVIGLAGVKLKMPPWVPLAAIGGSFFLAIFWAFHDVRSERDKRIRELEAGSGFPTGGSSDSRYEALSDLLGRSLTIGVGLSTKRDWPVLEAWKAHTRGLVAGAYGEGEAAHVFTPDLKPATVHKGSISLALLGGPPPLGDTINNLKALLGRMSSLAIRADFDPAAQVVFDPDAYRSEFARSTQETPSGIWTCPWCGWEADHSYAYECGRCRAEKRGDLVWQISPHEG